ncbi:MAG TPA: PH domain-containing protein [Thermoanaerobaculia bacterium]|nr:PH domain-containing protein [Thermoanaerobaculia bacterium]
MSLFSLVVLSVVPWSVDRVIPHAGPLMWVRPFIWSTCAAVAIGSLLFVVAGYEVGQGELIVRRLLWATRVDIRGLSRVAHDPEALRGSWRVFGNGGLFSFSGLFYNRELGRYRLFGTNLRHAVVIVTTRSTFVITPDDPKAFVQNVAAMR